MPTECPGRKMIGPEQDLVQSGELDFYEDRWIGPFGEIKQEEQKPQPALVTFGHNGEKPRISRRHLIVLKEASLFSVFLKPFENDLVEDMIRAIRDHGMRAPVPDDDQAEVLEEIAAKLGMEGE